jgi:hypothetical protein
MSGTTATDLDILTIGEAATELGLKDWRVSRLFERGLAPEPPRLGGRRVIRRCDLPALREAAVRAGYLPGGPEGA